MSTQRNLLTQVSLFFRWLTRNRKLLFNPAADLQLPRPEKRLPREILTATEVDHVINQADIHTPWASGTER